MDDSRYVDYFSHNWETLNLLQSWRNITRENWKNKTVNGVRLENISWRVWWKVTRTDKETISKETLKLLGHSDILYGPLYTTIAWEPLAHASTANGQQDQRGPKSHSVQQPMKPILYRRHSNGITGGIRRPPIRPLDTKSDSTIMRWHRHGNFRKVTPPRNTALKGQPWLQLSEATTPTVGPPLDVCSGVSTSNYAREPIVVSQPATWKPRRWTLRGSLPGKQESSYIDFHGYGEDEPNAIFNQGSSPYSYTRPRTHMAACLGTGHDNFVILDGLQVGPTPFAPPDLDCNDDKSQDEAVAIPSPTHTEPFLHLEELPTPYVTASNALSHAFDIEKPLKLALSTLSIGNEYVLQAGFNKAALHKGILLEELYLTLIGDLPELNDQALSGAMANVFAPFPGVVYTRKQSYTISIDLPTRGFRLVSSLGAGGFKMTTLSTSTGTSSGAGGEGNPGGNGNEDRKGKSREVPDHHDRNDGSKDEEGNGDDDPGDPDPGQPSEGGSSPRGGLYLTLTSKISIKAGDNISHVVSTRLDALIKVGSTLNDPGWPGPKIGFDMTSVSVAAHAHGDKRLEHYNLSQAEVTVVGCSTQDILLGRPTPVNVHVDGDFKKTTANKTVSSNLGMSFAAPNGPTLMAGVAMGKGQSAETVASRWGVIFNEVQDIDHQHLIDASYTSLDGGYWVYTPNADFDKVNQAVFMDDRSPSGIFRMRELAPTKVEMKVISFWELPSQPESGRLWIPAFTRRRPIPAFANFIFGVSTVVKLQNVDIPNKGIQILLADKFEAPLSEEPARTVKHSLQEDLEVSMVSAIMGRASLKKAEHHGQGTILF